MVFRLYYYCNYVAYLEMVFIEGNRFQNARVVARRTPNLKWILIWWYFFHSFFSCFFVFDFLLLCFTWMPLGIIFGQNIAKSPKLIIPIRNKFLWKFISVSFSGCLFISTCTYIIRELMKKLAIQPFHYTAKRICAKDSILVFVCFFFIGHNKTSIIFMTNKHTDLSLSLSLSFTLVPIHPFPFLLKQISCERWQSLCTAFELKSFKIHVYFNILYISLISTIRKLVQMRNNTLFSAKKWTTHNE